MDTGKRQRRLEHQNNCDRAPVDPPDASCCCALPAGRSAPGSRAPGEIRARRPAGPGCHGAGYQCRQSSAGCSMPACRARARSPRGSVPGPAGSRTLPACGASERRTHWRHGRTPTALAPPGRTDARQTPNPGVQREYRSTRGRPPEQLPQGTRIKRHTAGPATPRRTRLSCSRRCR